MKDFLISFEYGDRTSGEEERISVLVRARTFKEAITKVVDDDTYYHPINFENRTLE